MSAIEIIRCKICFEILKEPIRLPCEKYICKFHVNELEDKQITCSLCNQIHSIPENGWIIDENFRFVTDYYQVVYTKVLKDENYWELKKQLEEYERELEGYQVIAEHPDQIIEERFSNLALQVDLRSEILKQQIDKMSESLKDKINFEKKQYIKMLSKKNIEEYDIKKEWSKIEKSKKDLKGQTTSTGHSSILSLAGSRNETIKNWNIEKNTSIKSLKSHGSVLSLAALPNGDLASGSTDNTINIWNRGEKKAKITIQGLKSTGQSLVVFPNGNVASEYGDVIKIWNVEEEFQNKKNVESKKKKKSA